MTTATFGKLYAQAFATLLVLDALWIGVVAKAFYAEQIGFLMAPQPNWLAAALFYALFVFGLLAFVIVPGVHRQSPRLAGFTGGLFGLVTYATYDLTNLATLAKWPPLLCAVDMLWGTVLCAAVSAFVVRLHKRA